MNLVAIYEWFSTGYYPRHTGESWALLILGPALVAFLLSAVGLVAGIQFLRPFMLYWLGYVVALGVLAGMLALWLHLRDLSRLYKNWKKRRDQALFDMINR